jgi:Fe-S cluster assembly protein SufD
MTTEVTDTINSYQIEFERFEREAAGDGPAWLPPLRKAAFSTFCELGFPTRRDEEWRFTPIRPITEGTFCRATAHQAAGTREARERAGIPGLTGPELVFVNGKYAPELSTLRPLPAGVRVSRLAEALETDAAIIETHLARYAAFDNQAFVALNTAFLEDGAFVHIPRNSVVEEPIRLLFLAAAGQTPTISHPRTLIVAEENSQATILESYAGLEAGVTFTNAVTEIAVGANAVLDHYKLTQESDTAYHIATMQVELARGSHFASHNITLGGAIVRNDQNARLGGEGGACTLNGLYLARDRQLVDNHTAIDHALPHCDSHELYKGILDGRGQGVFNGKIYVRKDAQKTDAKQTNQTLLLSPEAQINTKPQLEIFADDVKCTHGATIGQLDANQLFYLRARGIGKEDARSLLIYAFAEEIIDRIKVDALRERLSALLFERLAQES